MKLRWYIGNWTLSLWKILFSTLTQLLLQFSQNILLFLSCLGLKMRRFSSVYTAFGAVLSLVSSTILQNGQVRITSYPNTVIDPTRYKWKTYPQSAHEISYKGRWDSKFISWWSWVVASAFPLHGDFFLLELNQLNEVGDALVFRLLRFKGIRSGCVTTPIAATIHSFGLNAFHSLEC